MTIELFAHPFSSYCQKAITAFYENDIPFELRMLEPGSPASEELARIWPIGKFPVLREGERVVPEATSIIEYLDLHHPGPVRLIPEKADAALRDAGPRRGLRPDSDPDSDRRCHHRSGRLGRWIRRYYGC